MSSASESGPECPLCLERFDGAKRRGLIMPACGHSVCRPCSARLAKGRLVTCPLCRRSGFSSRGGLHTNYALLGALANGAATAPQRRREMESEGGGKAGLVGTSSAPLSDSSDSIICEEWPEAGARASPADSEEAASELSEGAAAEDGRDTEHHQSSSGSDSSAPPPKAPKLEPGEEFGWGLDADDVSVLEELGFPPEAYAAAARAVRELPRQPKSQSLLLEVYARELLPDPRSLAKTAGAGNIKRHLAERLKHPTAELHLNSTEEEVLRTAWPETAFDCRRFVEANLGPLDPDLRGALTAGLIALRRREDWRRYDFVIARSFCLSGALASLANP